MPVTGFPSRPSEPITLIIVVRLAHHFPTPKDSRWWRETPGRRPRVSPRSPALPRTRSCDPGKPCAPRGSLRPAPRGTNASVAAQPDVDANHVRRAEDRVERFIQGDCITQGLGIDEAVPRPRSRCSSAGERTAAPRSWWRCSSRSSSLIYSSGQRISTTATGPTSETARGWDRTNAPARRSARCR